MHFLLPPSETKAIGGGVLSVDQVALAFGALTPARDEVAAALIKLCKTKAVAMKSLKLSEKQSGEIAVNKQVLTAPTMPAINRYTGTLYDAIHGRGLKGSATEFNELSKPETDRAKESVLIQSALFGLIPATSLIPNYRLSAGTALPGINLKQHWSAAHEVVWQRLNGIIIDLRSKAYADLAPLPSNSKSYTVDVYQQLPGGERIRLNHFNKKAKGQLVRAALQAAKAPETIADLKRCAKSAGLAFELKGNHIELITFEQVLAKRS